MEYLGSKKSMTEVFVDKLPEVHVPDGISRRRDGGFWVGQIAKNFVPVLANSPCWDQKRPCEHLSFDFRDAVSSFEITL